MQRSCLNCGNEQKYFPLSFELKERECPYDDILLWKRYLPIWKRFRVNSDK